MKFASRLARPWARRNPLFKGQQRKFNSINISSGSSKLMWAMLAGGVGLGMCLYNSKEASAVGAGTQFEDSKVPEFFEKEIKSFWMSILGEDDLMDFNTFLNAVSPGITEEEKKEHDKKYRTLYSLADKDKDGFLSFNEFLQFELLMTGPDADFRIAFELFDEDRNGLLALDEFRQVLLTTHLIPSGFNFDINCDWIKSYFGPNGKNLLNYSDFTQLLKGLEEELLRQSFIQRAGDKKFISSEEFAELISVSFSKRLYGDLPVVVTSRLNELFNEKVSYAEVLAFYNVLSHFPQVKDGIVLAAEHKRHPKVTKKEFLRVMRRFRLLEFTPLEAEIVFKMFDLDNDGLLSLYDYSSQVRERSDENKPLVKEKSSFLKVVTESATNFALGSVAGAIGATVVYPIDLVKTRMQNQRNTPGAEKLYNNSWDCFRKVLKGEGIRGLYRGLGPQLVGVAPEKAIKLTVNDLLRKLFGKPGGDIYFPLEILAGMGAGASQVIFTNPLEIVKIRLQTQGESAKFGVKPKNSMTIIRELGFRGLYKGAAACLLRDIPFSGIYFPAFAKCKEWMTDPNTGTLSKLNLLLAGTIAGIPAASLVTPADVIKTRLQVEARTGQQTYRNIPHAASLIYKTEGFKAFWKGAGARVFRSSPQFGVTLFSYELLQSYIAPDLKSPRPPTNVPVDAVDYDRLFRGGVGRSLRRADQRWGLFEK